jgi:hypothetical protein
LAERAADPLTISSEEVEVACDALWFAMGNRGPDAAVQALWDRLQPCRHGDCRGAGTVDLTADEAAVVGEALALVEEVVGMNPVERALAERTASPKP